MNLEVLSQAVSVPDCRCLSVKRQGVFKDCQDLREANLSLNSLFVRVCATSFLRRLLVIANRASATKF